MEIGDLGLGVLEMLKLGRNYRIVRMYYVSV